MNAADRERIAIAGSLCEYWCRVAAVAESVGDCEVAVHARSLAEHQSAVAFQGYWA
jgi:hypothetical protein